MTTVNDLLHWYGKKRRVLYVLMEDDVEAVLEERGITREPTDEEWDRIRKLVESGLGDPCTDVLGIAVDEVFGEEVDRGKPDGLSGAKPPA